MKEEKEISGFEYRVNFLDNYEIIETQGMSFEVETHEDYPEGDEEEARSQCDQWAETVADEFDYEDYEIELVNAY